MLIHTEEENKFQERLKELCKRYDEESDSFPDPYLVGESLYEFYCDEQGIECDYREEVKYEYLESDELITQIGELVCPAGGISLQGRVYGINGDNIMVSFPQGTGMMPRNQLRKVICKEI